MIVADRKLIEQAKSIGRLEVLQNSAVTDSMFVMSVLERLKREIQSYCIFLLFANFTHCNLALVN